MAYHGLLSPRHALIIGERVEVDEQSAHYDDRSGEQDAVDETSADDRRVLFAGRPAHDLGVYRIHAKRLAWRTCRCAHNVRYELVIAMHAA